ncbi:MAG: TlpA family protein disulfide reductase, partial [Bacteroidaceae bacterium]|nr:TlpA family protein disulfide reductase [Bacteroidaceae bacterium]
MKRITFLLALAFCLLSQAQKEVSLTIDLKGTITAKDTITLSWGAINKSMNPLILQHPALDISPIDLPLTEPRLIIIGLKGYVGGYELIAQPGEKINITGRIRKDDLKKVSEVVFSRIHVKGAAQQNEYLSIIKEYQEFIDSVDTEVFNEYKDVQRLIENAKKNKDEQAIADMYQTLHGQSYIDRVMSTFQERQDYMKSIVAAHSDSFMGPLLLLRFAGRLDKEDRPLYNRMSDEAKISYYGREVEDEVYPPTLVGDMVPTLPLIDIKGNEVVLNQNKSTYTLIDFWASWCSPCRKEIPNLKRLYQKYHNAGLEIVSISADQNVEDWKEALAEEKTPWPNYIDKNRQAVSEFKVQYIPSIFI